MTKCEAYQNLKDYLDNVFHNSNDYETYCYLRDCADTLAPPAPDPDTGLVPCGCGAPMLLMGDDETQYWVECGDSVHCPHFIGQAYDGAGIYQTPEEAIKATRVAMGWKGSAK